MEVPSFDKLDIDSLLYIAARNNLLNKVVHELASYSIVGDEKSYKLKKIRALMDDEVEKVRTALKLTDNNLNDYILIKTCKGFSRIPDDLDVYVLNYEKAVETLGKLNLRSSYLSLDERKILYEPDNITKIHIHGQVVWAGLAGFFDEDLLRSGFKRIKWHDMDVTVPSDEAELLLNMAHINYEKLYIDLVDLMYLFDLSKRVDWEIVFKQASKHHWRKSFERTLVILDSLYREIYLASSPFEDVFKHYNIKRSSNLLLLNIPVVLPRLHIVSSFIEKRLFAHIIASAEKSIRILLTGETFGEAKIGSELELLDIIMKKHGFKV